MKKIIFFFAFLNLAMNPLSSQNIIIGKEKIIQSNILNESRTYYISTPDDYDKEVQKKYPVLYVLDGEEYFELVASTVKYFANRGFMPQTIVVGIKSGTTRERDFTPSKGKYSPRGGGAKKFLSFLSSELIPEIEKSYKTQPHKTIYGASIGGLFAMYTLYNYPKTFDNYIVNSPSLYHDNNLLFKHALSYFSKESTGNKFVFLSLADEVYSEMRISFRNTIDLFKNKATQKNIRWSYKVYDDETHESTKLVGLNDGLRSLHEFWFVPFYQRDRGIEGLKDHYKMLNKFYNYKIDIPESLVARIAKNIFREGKTKQAYTLLKYNVDHFPNSPNTYNEMGEYYEKVKEYDNARKQYKLALDKAKDLGLNISIYESCIKRIAKL